MNDISITIKHEDTIIDFKGNPNEVLHSVNEFLLKSIPGIELAEKIIVNYSLEDILSKFPVKWIILLFRPARGGETHL